MRTALWLGMATAGIALAAAACGMSADSSAFGADSNAGKNNDPTTGGSDFGDAGTAPNASLQGNGILLVHAANASAFRLCFEEDLTLKPQPDATLMPAANVVGVEVGSAVRIDPIKHVAVPDATPAHRIFHFNEEDIRILYGPAGQNLTCETLLGGAFSQFATELPGFDEDLSSGLHVLALTGCAANTPTVKHSKAECGDAYDGTSTLALTHISLTGRERTGALSQLPAQVVNLSSVLDKTHGAKSIEIEYGDLVATDSGTTLETVVSAPQYATLQPPNGPKNLALPIDAAGYDTKGFRISLKDSTGTMTKIADQSLATINRLSSPRDLPTDYYQAASSYLFLVLGAPTPAYSDGGGVDPDELKNIHVLAVPVIVPETPDAGSDGSTSNP